MSPEEFAGKSYDYIICGGGTAGLVVASRLSEDANVTVGVVEAGGNRLDDVLINAPNLFTQLWGKPEYDWDYQTVPQVNLLLDVSSTMLTKRQQGTNGKRHAWVRGKVLGGSSAVNLNMLSMASRQDLDNWVELGNRGWGFHDLAPYYRKFEKYHPPEADLAAEMNGEYIDASLRGTSGPIQVSHLLIDGSNAS
jgi:choline dehydrogenase